MDNKEILRKAIDKAVDNGYIYTQRAFDYAMDADRKTLSDYVILEKLYYPIIFAHDFVQAFWNCKHELEEYKVGSFFETCKKCGEVRPIGGLFDTWKEHLKRMVLEEEPLKYLERFL